MAVLTSTTFVWSSLLAAPAQVLAQSPHWAAPKPIPLPLPHDDPTWHTIDYHAAEHAQSLPVRNARKTARPSVSLSLLDEVGRLRQSVSPDDLNAWKRLLHQPQKLTSAQAANLHVWVGEAALARDEQPQQALWHFGQAQKLAKPTSNLRGLATYDKAIALFYEGAYNQASAEFKRILTAKPALHGFERRTATLFWRHTRACAGYHAERANIGIPEPPNLDPLCGASALALALKAHNKPYDKKTILAHMRVTGRGSSMQDVVNGAQKLGLSARVVSAGDKGLMALPKPLVAYVEHDHFISVSKADEKGVSYLCSDCGPWPGGQVSLTWAQWHKMEATAYAVLSEPGSDIDGALSALSPQQGRAQGVQIAGAGPKLAGGVVGRMRWLRLFKKQGIYYPLGGLTFSCGFGPASQHCPPFVPCPDDSGPDCGGPSFGDPVNLATGEEEYTPAADLTVYNPVGPSVVWGRRYDSLRGNAGAQGYQSDDFGQSWSHGYNIGVFATITGQTATCYLMEPNGSRIALSTPQIPSASAPHVTCGVPAGVPMLAEWDYDSALGKTYFVLTHPDRSKWILPQSAYGVGGITLNTPLETDSRRAFCLVPPHQPQPNIVAPPSPSPQWFPLGQQIDRNGNGITFNYGVAGNSGYPLLSSIVDKNNVALLTLNRTNFHLTSVADRYGRSVYYHGAQHDNPGSSLWELDHVSQVVPTGAASPPDRYVLGYQNVDNGDNGLQGGGELVAMLHTITVPSPTGTGTATATINYLPSYCTVSSIVDANGNSRSYSQPDQNHTQVTTKDPQGNVVYRCTVGYDMNMSSTSKTDGTVNANGSNTTIIKYSSYADPNDPYRPSQSMDGNGYAVSGANGKGTSTYTWDQWGNCLTATTPRGTTTTNTYTYQNFAIGELTSTQTGAKQATTYAYYEPSGNVQSITSPKPGTTGGSQSVTTSFTYSALGDVLTRTLPGNGTVTSMTTYYNYTQDGSYSQTEALGQPLTITDNLGKSAHFRYDSQGRMTSSADPNGIVYGFTYNIAGQLVQTVRPATGDTGTGNSQFTYSFVYPGGPQTQQNAYDESGNLVRNVVVGRGPEGEEVSYSGTMNGYTIARDAEYRIIKRTDGNNHPIIGAYNQAGYLSTLTLANGEQTQVTTYDANGTATSSLNGRNTAVNLICNDPESRPTSILYPATPACNIQLQYDTYGRPVSISDSTGTQTMAYDDNDHVVSVSTTYLNAAGTGYLPTQTVSYTFNPDGSHLSMQTPAGTFNYAYDERGNMASLTNPYGLTFQWNYLDNGWINTQQSGNAFTTAYTYNALGLMRELANVKNDMLHTGLSDFDTIHHDAVGNHLSMRSTLPAAPTCSGTTSYSYDNASQLTQETSSRASGYTNTFGYDQAGNATTFRGAGRAFNSANEMNGTTYDGDGNPTAWNGNALTFNANCQLTAVGNLLTAGYNYMGQRAWKQSAQGRTYFVYPSGSIIPVCEVDANGNVTACTTAEMNSVLSRHTATGDVLYSYDPSGNTAQRMDTSGNILSSAVCDAFGAVTTNATGSDPYNGFGAQWGYYRDYETGLYLLGQRYYDAQTGRFLNRDPAMDGLNWYEFASNNSLINQDPTGLMSWAQFLCDLCRLWAGIVFFGGFLLVIIGIAEGNGWMIVGGILDMLWAAFWILPRCPCNNNSGGGIKDPPGGGIGHPPPGGGIGHPPPPNGVSGLG